MNRLVARLAAVAVVFLAACSGGGESAGTQPPPMADAGPIGDAASSVDSGLPPPPSVGIQLASTPVDVAANAEQYLCWSFELPKDTPLDLVATEPSMPKGVHHYALFTKDGAEPAKPTAYDCHVMDATWGLVSGGGVSTPGLTFPAGTAMKVAGGTQLVLQLHVLNASAKAITLPPASVNLVGSHAANLTAVGLLIGGTLTIDIPPQQSAYAVNGGCAAPYAMENIFAVFPHMHQLGTRISISVTAQGQSTPNVLLDRAWDFGTQGVYPATGSAQAGDAIQVTCTYDNPTADDVKFGESSTDEMCLGVLFYYPAAPTGSSQYCGF